jgi:hypothetical protein
MFKEMRRKDRALTNEEGLEVLNTAEYGILSTCGADGQPYGVPVSYAYGNDKIYFHCATVGHKLENIEKNNKVSFTTVGKTEVLPEDFATRYKSVVIFGKVVEIFDDEKTQGLVLILEKYSSDFIPSGMQYIKDMWERTRMFKIEVEHMTAKGRK